MSMMHVFRPNSPPSSSRIHFQVVCAQAQITSEVELDYSIDHYQAIEGARLQEYYVIAALAILLSLLILIGKIWLACTSEIHREGLTKFETVNIICLVVLPIVWFVTRSVQLGWSGYLVDHTVGHYGMSFNKQATLNNIVKLDTCRCACSSHSDLR